MFVKLLIVAVLACLAGCAQTPAFTRPDLPVPDHWSQSAQSGVSGGQGQSDTGQDLAASSAPEAPSEAVSAAAAAAFAKIHWRNYFADPQLQALIDVALENNRDLRIAAGRIEEARAQFGIARADLGPTFNMTGSGTVTRTSSDLSGFGAPLTSRRFDMSASLVSFEADFWGRVASLTESARTSYLSTEESKRAVYLSLVSDVATSYLTWLQFQELVASEKLTVSLRERSLMLIQKGHQAGVTNDFEYQQAYSLLESAQSTLASHKYQQEVALNRLKFLLGNAPFDLTPDTSLDQQGLDTVLEAGLPSDVLLLRPDVMAAELRLMATHANIAAARAAFLPKVALTTGLGLASQSLLGLFGGSAWSFQPVVSMPLFDGGRTASALALAEARKLIAVAEYERAIQVAFREVADLLAARTSLARQVQASMAGVRAQERRLEIARGRYEAGAGNFLEVLDAQREWIAARQAIVQVRRAQLESNVQLYKALGGGSQS